MVNFISVPSVTTSLHTGSALSRVMYQIRAVYKIRVYLEIEFKMQLRQTFETLIIIRVTAHFLPPFF